ncbi:MAG: hypothetical protein ACRDV9_03910, partial [Acidimicrobiia bacterium]
MHGKTTTGRGAAGTVAAVVSGDAVVGGAGTVEVEVDGWLVAEVVGRASEDGGADSSRVEGGLRSAESPWTHAASAMKTAGRAR